MIDTSVCTSYDSRFTERLVMPNRTRWLRSLAALAVVLVLVSASTPVQQADSSRYLNDIKALASADMEGRGAGTHLLPRKRT